MSDDPSVPVSDKTIEEVTPAPPAHELLDALSVHFGDRVLGEHRAFGDAWVRVAVGDWLEAAAFLKDEKGCVYFGFLSGMDWQPNPNLDGEKAYTDGLKALPEVIVDAVVRMTGGISRFQVLARLQDPVAHTGITLVADLDDEHPSAPSLTSLYRGADWHEREASEMFGFDFPGHPGLRNIYLPEGFEGHPLRKDFALASRVVRPWPGLVDMEEMPAAEAPEEDTQ